MFTNSYGRQWIDDEDIANVIEALKSDYLTQGPKVDEFERRLSETVGARYCVAVSNGTAALHLAVAALDLSEGTEGITSPITFAATANAVLYSGLKPVFADIDEQDHNISPERIRQVVTEKTAVLLPVHFSGLACDMVEIGEIAQQNGLRIIEDAAHAIGSFYSDGFPVGSCRHSDMTVFSFHPVKTITTAEGGAITTNDPELYRKLNILRTHGIVKGPACFNSIPGPWYYEMQELGFNYRLTDLQAALGIGQLKRLPDFRQKRQRLVDEYYKLFDCLDLPVVPQKDLKDRETCRHLFVVEIDWEAAGTTRTQVMDNLRDNGVGTQVHYIPVHLHPYYRSRFGYREGDFPVSERYYDKALSLPLHPQLTCDDTRFVVEQLATALR